MLFSPQGRQWEQHLYRGRGRGGEFECAPWDGGFDAVEEVSGSERGRKYIEIGINIVGFCRVGFIKVAIQQGYGSWPSS